MTVEKVTVTEGLTRLEIPKRTERKGPKSSRTPGFFNPDMVVNRDMSVMMSRYLHYSSREGPVAYLDLFSGCGAMGLRVAMESGAAVDVTFNDRSSSALGFVKSNIALNRLDAGTGQPPKVICREAQSLLGDERFEHIDIDPYGTPAPFIRPAMSSLAFTRTVLGERGAVVSLTATDTAPLCGTYPKVALRRYRAVVRKTPFMKEVGLRVLIGYAVLEAAQLDLAAIPILSFYHGHFFRVFTGVRPGAEPANDLIGSMGYIQYDPERYTWSILPYGRTDLPADRDGILLGPMWMGDMVLPALRKNLSRMSHPQFSQTTLRVLGKLTDEIETRFHYEVNELASIAGVSTPRRDVLLSRIKDAGHRASVTHYSPTSIKTSASTEELVELMG